MTCLEEVCGVQCVWNMELSGGCDKMQTWKGSKDLILRALKVRQECFPL